MEGVEGSIGRCEWADDIFSYCTYRICASASCVRERAVIIRRNVKKEQSPNPSSLRPDLRLSDSGNSGRISPRSAQPDLQIQVWYTLPDQTSKGLAPDMHRNYHITPLTWIENWRRFRGIPVCHEMYRPLAVGFSPTNFLMVITTKDAGRMTARCPGTLGMPFPIL